MMSQIDPYRYDFRNNGVEQPVSLPKPDLPEAELLVRRKKLPQFLKIVLCILLVGIILHCLYVMAVNPVAQLNRRLDAAQSCRIRIEAVVITESADVVLEIDGNLIAMTPNGDASKTEYFDLEDGVLYTYVSDSKGRWTRVESSEEFDIADEDLEMFEALFNPDNYERMKGSLFTWKHKDDVDVDGIGGVEVRRVLGRYTFKFGMQGCLMTMTFLQIGTKLDRPWEGALVTES